MSGAGRVRAAKEDDAWGPFVLLAGVIAMRSFVYFGLVTFIPLYYVADLHTSKAAGITALAVMLLGGALGTLIGGPLADRFGPRSVLIGSMLTLSPLIVGFLLSGPMPAVVFAGLAGAATIATFAVTIVMGQEYLPGRLGVSAASRSASRSASAVSARLCSASWPTLTACRRRSSWSRCCR